MKILIAGGSSQVGGDLSSILSKDFEVISSYRSKKPTNKNIKYSRIDFEKKIFIKIKPNIIINCIATHAYSKKKSFSNYFGSNICTLLNMIEFARKNKVKKIINISTISVYENTKKEINEKIDYNQDTKNLLAVSKSIGEIILKNSDIDFVNLRLPGVICSQKKTTNRPWIKNISHKLRNNRPIRIYNPNKLFNSLIDTNELARLIKVLCYRKISGSFNLCGSQPIKIKTLIQYLKTYFKSKSKVKIIKNQLINPSIISTKKLKTKIKFNSASVMKIIKNNLRNL